jgi:hypothetical protein
MTEEDYDKVAIQGIAKKVQHLSPHDAMKVYVAANSNLLTAARRLELVLKNLDTRPEWDDVSKSITPQQWLGYSRQLEIYNGKKK